MKSAERFGYLKKEREENEGIKEPTGSNKKKPFRAEGINGVKVLHVRPEDIPRKKEGERRADSNNSIQPTKRKINPPVPPPKPSPQVLLKRMKAKNLPAAGSTIPQPQPSILKKYLATEPPVTVMESLIAKPSSMPTMPVLQQDDEIGEYAVPFQRVNVSFSYPLRRKSSPAISAQQVSPTVLPIQTAPSPIPSFYEDDEDSYGYTLMSFPGNPGSPAKICVKDDGMRAPMNLREEQKDPTSFISQIDSNTSSSNDSDDDSYMDMTYNIKSHLHDLAQESSIHKTSSLPDITLRNDSRALSVHSKAGSDCTSSNIDLQSLENSSMKPLDVPLIHRQSQMHSFNGEIVEEDFTEPRKVCTML